MSAAEKIDLTGLDFFTESEAAHYCRVSLSTFRRHRAEYEIAPTQRFGRNMYARSDLYRVMSSEPTWQMSPSNGATNDPTFRGLRLAGVGAGPLANLTPKPLRKSGGRSRRS